MKLAAAFLPFLISAAIFALIATLAAAAAAFALATTAALKSLTF